MGSRVKDLSGQKFGLLTVIGRGEDYVSPKGYRRARWVCKCDCGGEALCQSGTLKSGRVQSCGCLQKKLASQRAKENNYRTQDITNMKFGKLTALRKVSSENEEGCIWECMCDCGSLVYVSVKRLNSGNTKSCGCLRNEKISNVNRKHSKSHRSRLYNVWVGMRQRCNDSNHKSYKHYGGRGISVCKEWDDFEVFEKWAIETGYIEDAPYGACTIDRIEVDGNYEPSNCRWSDAKTQVNNRRSK